MRGFVKYSGIRILLLAVLGIATGSPTAAQMYSRFEPGYYRQPLDGRMLLSANFAEARTNHFHSGIDVRTGGVEGKPLYAVADGYITRVNIAPRGYGRALYIVHPNGTTTVYAHMQKFTPEVEEYVNEQRHRVKKHSGDLYTEQNPYAPRFPVKKGDLIGYSGNSGSSAGPHLHFEIRETASQRILNIPKLGIYDLKDDIPPIIARLHYVEIDTVRGVPVNAAPVPIDVLNVSKGVYKLSQGATLQLGRCGYFVLEATDRKNDTQNTMGIYSVRMKVDGKPHFAFKIDSFLFDETRYVNSFTHYQLQKGSRNELLRLAVQANNRLPIYYSVRDRGALYFDDNQTKDVEIEVEDDNGNVSKISFKARLRTDGRVFNPDPPSGAKTVDCYKGFTHSADGLSVTIPADALYEPIYYTQTRSDVPSNPDMDFYSSLYRIYDEQIPLHSSITVSIDVDNIPSEMRSKLCFARADEKGKYTYAAAKYENGKVTGKVRNFGRYIVAADTTPPSITISFTEGTDMTDKDSFTVTLRDDLSGIGSFTATIDGMWIPFEEQGSTITHFFDDGRVQYNGGEHTLSITATDNKGNSATVKRTFVR